ncbi:MAG: ATP-dependent helicase [Thermoprotei archaeon]|nr:MAG: ATP-dependent helicase [Thermoprotei archaeon]RLF20536.1 MAG: ATP-dependent helicase [Thermoprotei archaeon]
MNIRIKLKGGSITDYQDVMKIADFVGCSEDGSHVFTLNLLKCARIPLDELDEILSRLGVHLPDYIYEKIASLRDYDVRISIKGSDLLIEAVEIGELEFLVKEGYAILEGNTLTYRAPPYRLWDLVKTLEEKGFKVKVDIDLSLSIGMTIRERFTLRDYQKRAYEAWSKYGRGVIVLPVGSGKTFIALKAIADLKLKTLVLVPTIDLLNQWADNISKWLDIPKGQIGIFGGGKKEIKDITVMTYDSAYINAEMVGKKFGLIIADECHHAVSQSFRRIFMMSIAKYRLGLTATPFRSDGLHKLYDEIIGPIVYQVEMEELQKRGYLAEHVEKRIYVSLTPEEKKEYERLMNIYLKYCNEVLPHIEDPRERFKEVLKLCIKDPKAREAIRARHKARQIALSAEKKIKIVEELLKKFANEKVIIFSRYTDIVREISRRFFIPKILHDTPKDERDLILRYFKEGKITKIATAMALDEGVDVPDATVAIVISGTGSNREYIQRLGRILRPKDKKAILIELITRHTIDHSLAYRRRRLELFEVWE